MQKLPSLSFTSQFFQYLKSWIVQGPLTEAPLHKLKVDLIASIGKVAGWIPGTTYVSIGAIMTAAIKTLPQAELSLFNSISRITSYCKCPETTKLFHQPILYLEERLTNSTLSVQAALAHIVDYSAKMPDYCSNCGEKPTEQSESAAAVQHK